MQNDEEMIQDEINALEEDQRKHNEAILVDQRLLSEDREG